MMKQYENIKKQYQDCLLFYRMGDFYELFLEDAEVGAQVLDITLTSRPKGKDGRIPMAGVPYHAVDAYVAKLVKAGHKVAICEQLTPPGKYGIVERDVVRIITPGTVMDEKALPKKENNYLLCIQIDGTHAALTAADISTGELLISQCPCEEDFSILSDMISHIQASECILPESLYTRSDVISLLRKEKQLHIYPFSQWHVYAKHAQKHVRDHFSVHTIAGLGLEEMPLVVETISVLLGYVSETQKHAVSHVTSLSWLKSGHSMMMDRATVQNLELFRTIRDGDATHTLVSVLDHTMTACGGRLLRSWIQRPLKEKEPIFQRLDAVQLLYEDVSLRDALKEHLKHISDVERSISRLSLGVGNPRDIIQLRDSLQYTLRVKKLLSSVSSDMLVSCAENIDQGLSMCISDITAVLEDDPPIDPKQGGLIRDGVDDELDTLRKTVSGSTSWIEKTEEQEKKRTGIGSLKIRFNQVFGFYIEISKANLALVPKEYMRKQTLVNGERFITPELKYHEEIILSSQEQMYQIEYRIFQTLVSDVVSYLSNIQRAAHAIATVDCLLSHAISSQAYGYHRPEISDDDKLTIVSGRHPVVEQILPAGAFVPNDIEIDAQGTSLLLVTGPNMAGKSVLLRQVALIVLMAQIGCFVPASSAHISVVDRIFVRSGASDAITAGLSTFMVEMVETSQILRHMTHKSLIIMDEIGRGTSTYDGISIAWAVAEYLVCEHARSPKTLFATHYHELQDLASLFPQHIQNVHMAITQEHDRLIFLYTILPGGASHSFGVDVAKLAGIPEQVIKKARDLLLSLERRDTASLLHPVLSQISSLDIARMTPLEAINSIASWQSEIKT